MDFAVLGPLRVVVGDSVVDVPGVKERALLAYLVAHAGRMVPASDLLDALWGEDLPRSAAKSLQTYIFRLRNLLEPQRGGAPTVIVTEGTGYRLDIRPEQVDATRFARLAALGRRALADGRPEAAVETHDAALSMWRGPAYAGLEGFSFAGAEARRLEEMRISALEDRCRAELDLGHHAAAVPEIERLVGDHPTRERLWALLALALYRAGRQGDALAALARARAVLSAELGVDPGPELQALHQRLQAQDPTLRAVRRPTPLPAELSGQVPVMVGRRAELSRLRQAWDRILEDGSVGVALRGPVGAGATRLAIALAHEVVRSGGTVVYARDGSRLDQAPSRPALIVVDHGLRELQSPGVMVLLLLGPRAAVPSGFEVVDLAPLARSEVEDLVREYVTAADLDLATDEVFERSGGWPGAAHDAVIEVCRRLTTERVGAALRQTSASSAVMVSAREDLTEGVAALRKQSLTTDVSVGECPWRGLHHYEKSDARWFFGRERLVAELVARLPVSPLVAVVGASGSGKSSLVRAGLLAALSEDVLPGSAAWSQIVLRPGEHPMQELAVCAIGAPRPDAGDVLAHLIRADEAADLAARTVLVVDQLEELWSVCRDADERATFLHTVRQIVQSPRSAVTVVLVVRADYLSHLADDAELSEWLSIGTVLVGSPTPAEIRRAVEQPARMAHLGLEDGLSEAIVSDAGAEPGLLPLLGAAMTQMWAARADDRLTFPGYVAIGGLSGAIAHLADEAYAGLDEAHQRAAKLLLLRLAGPGEGATLSRRRVRLSELAALPNPHVLSAVEALAAARLLTVSEGHVEVAHEALFREWPRLRLWVAEDVNGRAVQRRLAVAAAEWEAEDRDPALLWRGTRLAAALDLAQDRPDEITSGEQAFLAAAREVLDADQRAARDRAAASAPQNRRLRRMLIGLVSILVLALVFGGLAVRQRTVAEEATLTADAKRLAATALNIGAPDLALLTAEEAVKEEQSPETFGALLTLLGREPDVITRVRTSHRFLLLRPSADGRTVYLGENGGDLWAVDAQTGAVRWHVRSPATDMLVTMSVSPDGTTVLLSYATDASTVVAVDASTGAVTWRLDPPTSLAGALPSDADTYVGAAAWYSTTDIALLTSTHLCLVQAPTAQVRRCLALPAPFDPTGTDYETFLVWPDGRVSYAAGPNRSQSVVVHPDRWDQPTRLDGTVLGVSADGRRAAAVSPISGGHQLQLLDGPSLRATSSPWPLVDSQGIWTVAWSPDGSTLLVTEDQRLLVRDGATGAPRQELTGHSGLLRGTAVAGPAHDIAWSDGLDGTAVAFDLTGRRGIIRTTHGTAPGRGGATAATRAVAVTGSPQGPTPTANLVDASSGQDLGSLDMTAFAASQHCSCQLSGLALTPDGRQAVGTVYTWPSDPQGKTSGDLVVWDVGTRSLVKRLALPWGGLAVVVTPDGRRALVNGVGGYAFLDLTTWALSPPLQQPDANYLGGVAPNLAVSPDGRYAAIGRNEQVVLVDLQTDTESGRAAVASEVASLAFTPDASALAVGSFDGHVDFLSTKNLQPLAPRRQVSAGIVVGLAVSPDGKVLASLGGEGDLMLWDTGSWRPYGDRVINHDGFGLLYITPDSTTLRAFFNGVMKEIDIRPEIWVQAGCQAANRDFTSEESAVIRPDQPPRPTCPSKP